MDATVRCPNQSAEEALIDAVTRSLPAGMEGDRRRIANSLMQRLAESGHAVAPIDRSQEKRSAALRRVARLALDMRTWCAPDGFGIRCANAIAEAILGGGHHRPGAALARLEELERR